MFDTYKRMKKAAEAGAFAMRVQEEMADPENKEWRSEVKRYAAANMDTPYASSTAVHVWAEISEILRNACFYEEALRMGELAARHSTKLTADFADIRVEALSAYGLAQVESMMPEKAVGTLRKALEQARPGIRSYEIYRFHCGRSLAYACLKAGKCEEGIRVLDSLKAWIMEEKPSGLGREDLLFIDLSTGNILLYLGRYQEGLLLAREMEEKVQAAHLEDSPVYYKTLMMRALFEKMNNHIGLYYKLTKKAISYAKKAGDLAEERAYLSSLLDAMNRLGKSEEMFFEAYDILKILDETAENVDSLNMLQVCMNILLCLCQYRGMEEAALQFAEKAERAWSGLKAQGIECGSREALKIQSQFANVKLYQHRYREAEAELQECLARSRKALGEGDVDTLSVMELLARVKRQEQKYGEALDIFLEIEELRKDNGQEETGSCFETMCSIAYMYYFTGAKGKAFEKIFQYFEKIDRYSEETFLFFDEQAWGTFSYRYTEALRDVLGWGTESPEAGIRAERLYGLALRFKNRIYDEEMRWKAGRGTPQLKTALEEYYRLLKMPVLSGDEKGQMELLGRKRRLQEEISSYRSDFAGFRISPEGLEGALGEGEIILDYMIYNRNGEDGGEGYLVFCITREGICFRDLGERRCIDEDMEDFYCAVSLYQCSREYTEQMLVCVKGDLGLLDMDFGADHVRKVYLGLDGEWMPKMPWHYILSEYETRVLPSFAAFGKKAEGGRAVPVFSGEIAFFANSRLPLWEGADRGQKEKMALSLAIADISKIFLEDMAGGELRVYEGGDADREHFLSIHSPALLHVAVHGCSGAGGEGPGSRLPFAGQFQSSVMLMSGRKAYGCLPQNLAEYDGAVTMLDVMQMDLAGTELVVLNSCETGIGNFRRDEGVYGFPRAFFIAGAEGVLTCLWKVDAVFSVIFLDYFYRGYFAGKDMEEALAESRTAVRKMTAGDVRGWLERRRESIEAAENGKEIYARMEEFAGHHGVGGEEYVFDSPAYWACFALARKFTDSME